ncbi:hypothetical protein Efla_001204 [Eimeria flavescens]
MPSEAGSEEAKRRGCPLSACGDVVDDEQSQSLLVSVGGVPSAGPWVAEQVVEVRRPEVEERVYEVPQVIRREKLVEDRRQIIGEKVKYVPKYETVEHVTHVPKHVTKEVFTDVPQVQVVERTVEVPTTVYQDMVIPVPKPVVEERTTEVVKPVFVEKVVEVPRVVHRPYPVDRVVEVPQTRVEYRYRDVPVPRRVVRAMGRSPVLTASRRQAVPPLRTAGLLQPSTIRWRGERVAREPPPGFCGMSPRSLLSACWAGAPSRSVTQEVPVCTSVHSSKPPVYHHYPAPSPARCYTTPISEGVTTTADSDGLGAAQPFVVEGAEPAADAAGCCMPSPRRPRVKRSEMLLAPSSNPAKPIRVRVATLSPRRPAARSSIPSPRAASVPSAMKVKSPLLQVTTTPPTFHPLHVPVYQFQPQVIPPEPQLQQEPPLQQEQQLIVEATEPWIRTKLGDMPFSEFEKLNNTNSLVPSPRPASAFSSMTFAAHPPQQQQQQQQQQQHEQQQARRQQQQREQEARRLFLQQQQQREEEARRMYEQQEQQRLEQLRLLEQQRREAEARRKEEVQQLQQELQRQREQHERELQQRREEAQRRQEEERQAWMAKMQEAKEQMEQLQRQQQRKEFEELLHIQERQLREQEERQQRFMHEQEQALAGLLQQQKRQQEQLQLELKEHQRRLQDQQQVLRAQQEQALRQLQETHMRQQQKLVEETQRKAEASWADKHFTRSKQQSPPPPPLASISAGDDMLIETRFGLMPYRAFQALNGTNALKGIPTAPAVQFNGWRRAPDESTRKAACMHAARPPALQQVVYASRPQAYCPMPHQQQYYYVQQPARAATWASEAANKQSCMPTGGEKESIKAAAQRIGQDAAAAGSQVYGGVKTAVNSEVTQDFFRSVGDLVADAYNSITQRRQ